MIILDTWHYINGELTHIMQDEIQNSSNGTWRNYYVNGREVRSRNVIDLAKDISNIVNPDSVDYIKDKFNG